MAIWHICIFGIPAATMQIRIPSLMVGIRAMLNNDGTARCKCWRINCLSELYTVQVRLFSYAQYLQCNSVCPTDVSERSSYAKRIVCKSNVFLNTLALSSCTECWSVVECKRFRITSVNASVRVRTRRESENLEFINAIYFNSKFICHVPHVSGSGRKERSSETDT